MGGLAPNFGSSERQSYNPENEQQEPNNDTSSAHLMIWFSKFSMSENCVTARSSTCGSWCCKLEEHADMRGLSGFFRSLSEAKRAILARGTTKPNLQQACGCELPATKELMRLLALMFLPFSLRPCFLGFNMLVFGCFFTMLLEGKLTKSPCQDSSC